MEIKIGDNLLNAILNRFERDVYSYGFGRTHNEIITMAKQLQDAGADLKSYYWLNKKINSNKLPIDNY